MVLVSSRRLGFGMGPFHVHLFLHGDLQCRGCRGFRLNFFSPAHFAGCLALSFLSVFGPYLSVSPLPGFQYSCSLFFVPVDVGNILIASKVLKHLLGSHQLEHGLQGLGTGKEWKYGGQGEREQKKGGEG